MQYSNEKMSESNFFVDALHSVCLSMRVNGTEKRVCSIEKMTVAMRRRKRALCKNSREHETAEREKAHRIKYN